MNFKLPLGISARHAHLTREHMDILFGKGTELTVKKPIGQPGQYASNEQIVMVTPKGEMKLRVIGPLRPYTQIELSATDARTAGVDAPIRNSGDIEGSAGAKLIGPKGEVTIDKGIIVAARHIHLCPATGEKYNVKDGDIVQIKTEGPRSITFNNVLARVGESHADECHIDTDEGNACGLGSDAQIDIITK